MQQGETIKGLAIQAVVHRSLNMYQFPMRCFCFQVLICSDMSEVAGNIRGISEHCMASNRERTSEDWLSRQWFTEVSTFISSQ